MVTSARIIDFIDKIKNTEITGLTLHRLRTLLQTLVSACDSKPLKTFPVKIIDGSINKIGFEIRSTYYPELRFFEVPRFVINSLVQAEKNMDDTRCLDALCVLRDYCNILVYSRFDCCLKLEPKVTGDQL